MKRVTERSDLASKQAPQYQSGCRQFEGEDLGKYFASNPYILPTCYSLPCQTNPTPELAKRLDQGAKKRKRLDQTKRVERRERVRRSNRCHHKDERHARRRVEQPDRQVLEGSPSNQPGFGPAKERQREQLEGQLGKHEPN